MKSKNIPNNEEIHAEIALHLRCDIEELPFLLTPDEVAHVLGVKPITLATWRSTGRYSLAYLKIGRCVRYRVSDLAAFLVSRRGTHTGELRNDF
ncbi:helix-turn-helix domain-containing protein [Stutzerimonas stutzeri]|uniref:helix-turn-helix domain-containing protein n=1 Tax=Stutzerimonas sp. S1 TaxID=3030652 RepID=UPI002224D48F|nr:helix-turn-helix domain-containing protein [Stutzerimonas sp. S1]MCW3149287.1 helix-turn-helix domain-containing protein [Stutzerimonas sp. S1]